MKVDLRNNMLDKKSTKNVLKKKKRNDWKKIFSTLLKSENTFESESVKELEKKSFLLDKNKKQNHFSKIDRIGVGQEDFYTKPKIENKKKSDFPKGDIKSDYQENIDLSYKESKYIKNFPEKILIKWQGPDHENYKKSKNWYITMGLILSAIVVYAIYYGSPLMAIVFILIGIVGYIFLERDPQIVDFAVSYDGIVIGNEVYEFDDIKSFWIFYDPPHTRIISLYMKDKFLPYIHIPLHQVDPVEVREKMMKFIPEIKQEQSLIDVLERLLHI